MRRRRFRRYARDPTTKHSLFETVSLDNRAAYFATSCKPITQAAESDMELLSVSGADILHVVRKLTLTDFRW